MRSTQNDKSIDEWTLSRVNNVPGTSRKEKQDPKPGLVEEELCTHMHITYNPSYLWPFGPLLRY